MEAGKGGSAERRAPGVADARAGRGTRARAWIASIGASIASGAKAKLPKMRSAPVTKMARPTSRIDASFLPSPTPNVAAGSSASLDDAASASSWRADALRTSCSAFLRWPSDMMLLPRFWLIEPTAHMSTPTKMSAAPPPPSSCAS